jgi:hypothetical protein
VARVLIDGRRYEGLGIDALARDERVEVVLENSAQIFPGYVAAPFHRPHIYEQDEGVPDFALIREDYGEWWVGIVYCGDAPDDELLPAVSILRRTTYGFLDADSLCAAADLDRYETVRLTRDEQPRVVVVTGGLRFEWAPAIEAEQSILTIVEVFEAEDGSRLVRINGEQPAGVGSVVATCRIDPVSPRLVQVSDGSALGDADEMLIVYLGGAARWSKLNTDGGTCLYTSGRNQLPHGETLDLVRTADGRLMFRANAGVGGA